MSGIGARGAIGQSFKEIITRAVYGCGEGVAHGVVTFPDLSDVKKVLGATATEFKAGDVTLKGSSEGVTVVATGQFDVHVWYLSGDDTAITKQAVSATVDIPVAPLGKEPFKDLDVRVWVVKQPVCGCAVVTESGGCIEVEVDATLAAEVMGETKLKVAICSPDYEPPTTMKPPKPSSPPAPVLDWSDREPDNGEHDD